MTVLDVAVTVLHVPCWAVSVSEERCMKLRRPQKINHFPGMQQVAHKCKLARHLNRLRDSLPLLFAFHPETFNLPVDAKALERACGEKNRTFIVKPDDGACGVGIFLTRKPEKIPAALVSRAPCSSLNPRPLSLSPHSHPNP